MQDALGCGRQVTCACPQIEAGQGSLGAACPHAATGIPALTLSTKLEMYLLLGSLLSAAVPESLRGLLHDWTT